MSINHIWITEFRQFRKIMKNNVCPSWKPLLCELHAHIYLYMFNSNFPSPIPIHFSLCSPLHATSHTRSIFPLSMAYWRTLERFFHRGIERKLDEALKDRAIRESANFQSAPHSLSSFCHPEILLCPFDPLTHLTRIAYADSTKNVTKFPGTSWQRGQYRFCGLFGERRTQFLLDERCPLLVVLLPVIFPLLRYTWALLRHSEMIMRDEWPCVIWNYRANSLRQNCAIKTTYTFSKDIIKFAKVTIE